MLAFIFSRLVLTFRWLTEWVFTVQWYVKVKAAGWSGVQTSFSGEISKAAVWYSGRPSLLWQMEGVARSVRQDRSIFNSILLYVHLNACFPEHSVLRRYIEIMRYIAARHFRLMTWLRSRSWPKIKWWKRCFQLFWRNNARKRNTRFAFLLAVKERNIQFSWPCWHSLHDFVLDMALQVYNFKKTWCGCSRWKRIEQVEAFWSIPFVAAALLQGFNPDQSECLKIPCTSTNCISLTFV